MLLTSLTSFRNMSLTLMYWGDSSKRMPPRLGFHGIEDPQPTISPDGNHRGIHSHTRIRTAVSTVIGSAILWNNVGEREVPKPPSNFQVLRSLWVKFRKGLKLYWWPHHFKRKPATLNSIQRMFKSTKVIYYLPTESKSVESNLDTRSSTSNTFNF